MKKSGKTCVLFMIALLAAAAAWSQSPAQPTPTTTAQGFSQIAYKNFTLQWKVEGQNLNVSLSHPSTGWIAVGFCPSNKMADADIIIGYAAGGQAHVEEHYGTAPTAHKPGASAGITGRLSNTGGRETGGATTISFTLALSPAAGAKGCTLQQGQMITVILANAPNGSDDFSTYHGPGNRYIVRVKL